MATTNQHQQASVGTEQVWHQVAKASFAVLSHITPTGEPRSGGVVYKTVGRRLYVAVAPDSWKARHIAASRRVAASIIEVVPEGSFLTYHWASRCGRCATRPPLRHAYR